MSNDAKTWTNWAGSATCLPNRWVRPSSVEGVAAAVAWATEQGLHVRAVGAGHSFTPIVETDGVLMNLDLLRAVGHPVPLPSPDPVLPRATHTVTVGAGIRLRDLNVQLAGRGLALANLGDIDAQSIAGAISTGTHGTGGPVAGVSAQVRGVELVLASGQIVRADADSNPRLFSAAQIGLGTLGILTAVTLAVEPAYALRAIEEPWSLDRVFGELDELTGLGASSSAHQPHAGSTHPSDTGTSSSAPAGGPPEHFEFYWFPHTRRTLIKRNERTETDDAPLGGFRRWLDDEFLSNTAFELINRVARVAPASTLVLNEVSARALSARMYTAPSPEVFITSRRVRFHETEWAIPYETLPEVLTEIDQWIDRSRSRIAFPVEVRFARSEDLWLSTAFGRQSAYVAVHEYHRNSTEPYFRAVQEIMRAHGGRPHWGKMNTLGADYFAERYPHMADFKQVRAEHDPEGLFLNPYTRRILDQVGS